MENIKDFVSNNVDEDFIYRGCAYKDYDLIPSLAVALKKKTTIEQYIKYNEIIKREAKKRYSEVGLNGHLTDLSQHYGLNTNALDWTESIYIALYFAFTNYIIDFVENKLFNLKAENLNEKFYVLRKQFNDHYCYIYKFNLKLWESIEKEYRDELPLKIIKTDKKNQRMCAQKGLLSIIDWQKSSEKDNIKESQLDFLNNWLNKNYQKSPLNKEGSNYFWEEKTLLEKNKFSFCQRNRVELQKLLKDKNVKSTKLFPDFEGVKKNIKISEYYNILCDYNIAFNEPKPHENFERGFGETIKGVDQLGEGEFFKFI